MAYMLFFYRRRVVRRRPRRRSVASRRDYLARKEAARALIMERLGHFQAEYARLDPLYAAILRYNRVAVRDTRSRWGSCTSRKNLNFNYRILDLSPELRDYVIAHELCHLKELHHGRAFWDMLELAIPGARGLHREARKVKIA